MFCCWNGWSRTCRGVLLILALALAATNMFAGDVLHFSGVVADPTGAVVAHAQVTVVNEGTDARKSIVSDAEGWFELLLPAGTYHLSVEAPGFQTYAHDGLVLGPTASLRVDVALQLPSQQENVLVTTVEVQVDTASTQVGEGISQEQMTTVPLN